MSNFDQLRFSFDNILKELDDICKSIDDLTDIEQLYLKSQNKTSPEITSNPTYRIPRLEVTSESFNAKKYQNYQLDYNLNRLRTSQQITKVFPDRSKSFKLDNQAYEKFKKNLITSQTNSSIETNLQSEPTTLKQSRINSNKFKKHRLPTDADSTPLLSNYIGSAQDTAAFFFKTEIKPSPIATTTNTLNQATLNPFKKNSNDQASFSSKKINKEFERFSPTSTGIPHSSKFRFSNNQDLAYNQEEDDYLNAHEISKIESFYNSMGCYVFVSHSEAELYKIKLEDEFDSVDADPVNDYHVYMNNKLKKDNGDDVHDDDSKNKSNVNYMYIKSGVPVIIFNYGNPKRTKELRIVLAERSTGFCMFEFKFDSLTQFDNSNETTVIRLSQTNSNNSSRKSNFTSSTNLSYHNEYFERFFNSKSRHAFKEHLLKFVIKRDCDEFCSRLIRIMNDKRNCELFSTNESLANSVNHLNESYKNKIYFQSNQSLNSLNSMFCNYQGLFANAKSNHAPCSSLIVCHFDLMNVNSSVNLNTNVASNSMQCSLSLGKLDTILGQDDKLDTVSIPTKKSSIKPVKLQRKHSASASNIIQPGSYQHRPYSDNLSAIETSNFMDYESIQTGSLADIDELKISKASQALNNKNSLKQLFVKNKKLKKSEISNPTNFNHVAHLDKPVPIGKRYKLDY